MDDLLLGILPDAGNVLHARRALRWERVFRDRQSPLDAYNDDELVARYRFDRQHILEMVDAFSDHIGPWTERSHAIPATLQVVIASGGAIHKKRESIIEPLMELRIDHHDIAVL